MASFTDDPIQLSPYVQQQPIEQMMAVGVHREQQFQEGIKTVQGFYNNLLSLPIAKRETQEYVKEKVGQLNTSVKQSISGDFSNQRLLNQIGGLASQIATDPIVQNGIQSTAKIQAGMTQAKADQELNAKNGKNPVQNVEYFQDAVSRWLTDGDVGTDITQYTQGYTPYVDIIDRAMKLYKEQNPGQDINADAFRYDENGKIIVNPTLREGISPARIQSVLNLVYQSPDVQKQLNIEGWYKFRNINPDQLATYLTETTNMDLQSIQATIRELQIKLATDATVNSTQVSQQIEQLKAQADNLKKEYTNNADLLTSGNFDGLKSKLAKQEITSNFINAYSQEVMKKSPLWEVQMEIAKHELELSKFGLSQDEFEYKKKHDADTIQLEREKMLAKLQGKVDENGNPITGVGVVTDLGNVQENAGKLGSATFDQLYEEKSVQLNQGLYGLVFSLVNNSELEQGQFNPIKVDPATGGYTFNVDPTGKTGFPSVETARAEYRRLYEQGRAQLMQGGAKPSLIREYQKVDPLIRTVRNLGEQKTILDSKKKEFLDVVKKETGVANPDYIEAYIVQKRLPGWQNSESRLKQKYGNEWDKSLGIKGAEKTNMRGDFVGYETGKNEKEFKKFASQFDESLAPKLQAIEEDYKSRQQAFTPLVSTILASKPEEKEDTRQRFANITSAITEDNLAYKSFRKLLSPEDNKNMDKNIYGGYQDPLDGKFYLTIKNDKSAPERIEVSQKEFESIPGFKTTNAFWQKFGDDLSLTNLTTTDVPLNGKPGGKNTAYPLDMPPTSKYDVRYHVTGDGKGTYNLNLYILDKKGNVILDRTNAGLSTTMSGIMDALEGFKNDQIIEAIIHQNNK